MLNFPLKFHQLSWLILANKGEVPIFENPYFTKSRKAWKKIRPTE